jgi:hypothetical protein
MPSPSPTRAALKRELLLLVGSIVALDVVALLLRHYLRIAARGENENLWFTGLWIAATLIVVLPRMTRIRRIRDEARRQRLRT